MKTVDCSTGLHEYCTPCECECHKQEPVDVEALLDAWDQALNDYDDGAPAGVLENAGNELVAALRRVQVKDANTNPNERGFNPDTDIPDCRPKRQ